jgi:hypothetical protein
MEPGAAQASPRFRACSEIKWTVVPPSNIRELWRASPGDGVLAGFDP